MLKFEKKNLELKDLFPTNERYSFLVGAGISIDPPSSLISANDIAKGLIEFCSPKEEINNLLSLDFASYRYETLIEFQQDLHDPDLEFMDFFEEFTDPNLIHYCLAGINLMGANIATTNFDYFLELSLSNSILKENLGKQIELIISKEDYEKTKSLENIRNNEKIPIIKLHGSKKNIITNENKTDSLITTTSAFGKDREKGRIFDLEVYKKPLFDQFLKNRCLIVMGYSGRDDFDIGPALKEANNIKRIIWIEHSKSNNKFEIHKLTEDIKGENNPLNDYIKDISPHHLMLKEIFIKQNIEIYIIKGNTMKIANKLAEIFLQKNSSPYYSFFDELNNQSIQIEQSGIKRFREFGKKFYKEMLEQQKYDFASGLFLDFGNVEESLRLAKKGLLISERSEDLSSMGHFCERIAGLTESRGNIEDAVSYYTKAIQIARKLGDKRIIAKRINGIALFFWRQGQLNEAKDLFKSALQLYDQLGSKSGISSCLNNMGMIIANQGNLDKGLEYFKRSLVLKEEYGDISGIGSTLNNIGFIYLQKGELNIALEYFKKVFDIDIKLGNIPNQIETLINIGQTIKNQGNYQDALENFNEALNLNKILGHRVGEAQILEQIAHTLLFINKDKGETVKILYKILKIYSELKMESEISRINSTILSLLT